MFLDSLIGIWLHESGVLGASPDGIVVVPDGTEKVLLEVKCPYKHRDQTVMQAALSDKDFCLGN